MLSRRECLVLAGAVGFGVNRARAAEAPTVRTPVNFDVPKGACDCHVHVFPDPVKFPFWNGRVYTPPVVTAEDLLALQSALHMDRVVIVTPSVYGSDNAATLDGIKTLGPQRARGVAVIGASTTSAELDAMEAGGIRGIRVNLETGGVTDPAVAAQRLDAAVGWIKGRSWHMQIYARLSIIAALKARLEELPMPIVFDHFAGAQAALGVAQPGFDAVLELVHSGKAYIKISGAYRASNRPPDYPDVAPLAKALVAANSERIIWGSDWPHPDSTVVPQRKPTDIVPPVVVDDGRVLDLLPEWVPDGGLRRAILVDNPARLYQF